MKVVCYRIRVELGVGEVHLFGQTLKSNPIVKRNTTLFSGNQDQN
jgi:hypothetical protein